jgi:hypothetical protein
MVARDDAIPRSKVRPLRSVGRFVSSAAIALAVLSSAPAVHAQQKAPPSEQVAQAEARFFAGQKHYQEQKFHDALTEFRASYELVKSPNSLLYVARCYRELNQIATAYDTYVRLIAEAGTEKKYAKTKKAAEEEQAEIAGKVGRIVIDMPEDVRTPRVRVGYRNVDSTMYDRELTIEAGKVVVHADAPGHKPFDWQGEVAAGETRRVEVLLPVQLSEEEERAQARARKRASRIQTKMHPLRPLAYVSGGVGLLGLLTFGIFGSAASDRFEELDARCDGRCPPGEQDEVDAGRRETVAGNVGLAVGLVGLAGGVTIFLLTPSEPLTKPPAEGTSGSLSLRVLPSSRGPTMSFGGAF